MTIIRMGARRSPLSQAQVKEVKKELLPFHPDLVFEELFLDTQGDLDLSTSLIGLEKSDFFTKEIDALLLAQKIDVAIHSAKDLPSVLPQGLCLAALTKGVDARDVLVLKEGKTLETLSLGARVGTSSERRIAFLKTLREDLVPVDIRGTIGRRLAFLDEGQVEALIMAEAALIRLGLTERNRIFLQEDAAPLQGQLALVVHEDNQQMHSLFKCLDTR